ncbi:hypothetical protein AA313_de0206303 [Arthrobotrys entomopaga]|nr:hypothetical protein AA313_de0206303 [Arthrobotrys entomopaga]
MENRTEEKCVAWSNGSRELESKKAKEKNPPNSTDLSRGDRSYLRERGVSAIGCGWWAVASRGMVAEKYFDKIPLLRNKKICVRGEMVFSSQTAAPQKIKKIKNKK